MKHMFRWFLVLVCLLIGSTVYADTLTCNCSPDTDLVTGFQLQFDNGTWMDVPALTGCGVVNPVVCFGNERTICYDLVGLADGQHTVVGRAVSLTGLSTDSLPFSFTLVSIGIKPSSPSLLRVIK